MDNYGRFLEKGGNNEWTIIRNGSNNTVAQATIGTNSVCNVSGASIFDGQWHMVDATFNYSTGAEQLYVDGTSSGSATCAPVASNRNGDLFFGTYGGAPGTYGSPGDLDEVELSNTIRSADWINTEYYNQVSGSTFYSVGGEQTP